jgi:hypothetical protein
MKQHTHVTILGQDCTIVKLQDVPITEKWIVNQNRARLYSRGRVFWLDFSQEMLRDKELVRAELEKLDKGKQCNLYLAIYQSNRYTRHYVVEITGVRDIEPKEEEETPGFLPFLYQFASLSLNGTSNDSSQGVQSSTIQ